jgi:putative addiction module antidote
MHYKLKVIQVGNSLGVTLPREALADMKIEKGATLILTQSSDGYRLTPYDPEIERQVEAGREVMSQYRDTLRALAK